MHVRPSQYTQGVHACEALTVHARCTRMWGPHSTHKVYQYVRSSQYTRRTSMLGHCQRVVTPYTTLYIYIYIHYLYIYIYISMSDQCDRELYPGATNLLSFKEVPSPPSWCFRGYFHPLFINLEDITLCSELPVLHKPWVKAQNLIFNVVFRFWL